jgi:hypothetical protein
MKLENALTVATTGANITTGASSASVAIPNNSIGARPRYVRLAATAACYVRLGTASVTAAAGDMLVQPGDCECLVLNTAGFTHVAAIQVSAAGILNITPLDD